VYRKTVFQKYSAQTKPVGYSAIAFIAAGSDDAERILLQNQSDCSVAGKVENFTKLCYSLLAAICSYVFGERFTVS